MSISRQTSNDMIIGRFAPSPTGPLHLGSLVAALGSWLFTKSRGGLWLLRMDDLDSQRVVPGMADDILRTLEALGFAWDGEVVYQSGRSQAYGAALEYLGQRGLVYPCACSRTEISRSASAPHGADGELRYPGTCRNGIPAGKSPRALRVRVGEETISFRDGVMGEVSECLALSCGDFVVRRADGPFAYQLAVVVDDYDAGVSQVVRGADLLSSTPRQIFLQRLLGYDEPDYSHLPLVTGESGAKLSKRDNAVSVADGRDLAKDGSALLHAALHFLGQAPPATMLTSPCAELLAWGVANFDAHAIPRFASPFPGH